MKILFVCSCLEPGMDGVGDYTRRLAEELVAAGHECTLLALADGQIKDQNAGEFASANGVVSYLRLPSNWSWSGRIRHAKAFCESIAPDWVSFQIVPYGFDVRGLCFGLGGRLKEIAGKCRSQVMFHEIWIGEAEHTSLKQKFIGKMQRHILKDLLQKLRPAVVHTHTPLYQHLLGKLGAQAVILRLFGNIPLTTIEPVDWLKEKWPEGWSEFGLAERDLWWIFVIFGSIHPEWDAEDFWQHAAAAALRAGRKCLFISIGRVGAGGERALAALQKHEGVGWRFLVLGPQPEDDVSLSLLTADFGVSAVPPENIFKSGTASAMTEHGLPIIVSRPAARYPNCPPELLLVGLKHVSRDFNLEGLKRFEPETLLPGVAQQFIDDLASAPET